MAKLFARNIYRGFRWMHSSKKPSLKYPEPEIKKIANGMQLFHLKYESNYVSVGFFLPTGSILESPEIKGATFIIEQAFLKDAQKIIDDSFSKHSAVVDVKGSVNYLTVSVTMPLCDIEKAFYIISTLLKMREPSEVSLFQAQHELMNEKSLGDNYTVTLNEFRSKVFEGIPLGNKYYVPPSIRSQLTFEEIECYARRLLRLPNMTLICVTDVPIEKYVKNYISKIPVRKTRCKETSATNLYKTIQFSPGLYIDQRDSDNYCVMIGVAGPGLKNSHKDIITMGFVRHNIADWDSSEPNPTNVVSKLATLVSKENYCDNFKSVFDIFPYISIWGLYYEGHKSKAKKMLETIQYEWAYNASYMTHDDMIRILKETRDIVNEFNALDHYFDVVRQLSYGNYTSLNKRLKILEATTLSEVKDVMEKYVLNSKPAVLVLGDGDNFPDYTTIESQMKPFA